MRKAKKPKHFIYKPVYEGGMRALRQFIADRLTYPKEALKHKVQGTVKVRYDVNYLGKVVRTRVIESLGYGCDEEAQRLVSLLTFTVRKTRNVKVLYHKNLLVRFRLQSDSDKDTVVKYQYTTNESPKSSGNSYFYTIDKS